MRLVVGASWVLQDAKSDNTCTGSIKQMENKDQPKALFDPEDYRYLPPELLPNTLPVVQAWRFCGDAGDPPGLCYAEPLSAFMAPDSGFIAQFAELDMAELVSPTAIECWGLDRPAKLGSIYYPRFGKIVWQPLRVTPTVRKVDIMTPGASTTVCHVSEESL
jgi:hypothetical protein